MKRLIINHWMNIIKKNKDYDDKKLAEIEYGLVGLYLTLSKSVVIFILALILGIFKEVFIFLIIYNLIRLTSFGIHAKKSWICLVSSIIVFIGTPIVMLHLNLNFYLKLIIGIIGIIHIYIYSPADTKKRPIVNKKRRLIYKLISTGIAITFTVISLLISNNYLSNCMLFALIIQNIFISPITYKICKEPYNNYITFLKNHPEFT